MKAISDLWIKRAMRTDPIELVKITDAIKRLYAAANLKEPRVIIVPSPRIMAFSGGFSAAIWWLRKNPNNPFMYAATDDATIAATRDALVQFFLSCSKRWYECYQGGNMWAGWTSYVQAMRDVLNLKLPIFEKYQAWEDAAIYGGFRWMHEEFCIVSDFPEVLKKDDQNRPHCDNGPSHRWRDGWEIYFIHGVKVNRQIVMHPETITIDQVRQEKNAEVRRVMIERMGWDKFCSQAKLKVIHTDTLTSNFPNLPISETVHADMRAITSYRKGTEIA